MSEDVVYSEVVFVKRNKTDRQDPDQSLSAAQASRSHCGCVQILLVAVCFLMTAGLIALSLQYVYTEKKLKDLQELHNAVNENFTVLSEVVQDIHNQQQNLPRALNDSACSKDWEYHAGKCYLFSTNPLNWRRSRDACVSDGGHLVIINNQEEQEFLMDVIKTKYKDKLEFWIGLTDNREEGVWLWVDSTELNKNIRYWSVNEPDNWKGPGGEFNEGEDCAHIQTHTQGLRSWFDASCVHFFRRICETRSCRQT